MAPFLRLIAFLFLPLHFDLLCPYSTFFDQEIVHYSANISCEFCLFAIIIYILFLLFSLPCKRMHLFLYESI